MSGSFLKASKKSDGSRSFYEALIYNYGTEIAIENIQIGRKLVEIYGFEKLQRIQRQFENLEVVSLSRALVSTLHDEEEQMIRTNLTNLKELDLSFNLMNSFEIVIRVLRNLRLQKLNLTGNKFAYVSLVEPLVLDSLNLTMTYPTNELLMKLPSIFPNLKDLSLCDNIMTGLHPAILDIRLENLDLSMNALTTFPQIQQSIQSLNLSYNQIAIDPAVSHATISKLDIRHNNISKWSQIETLASNFPRLTNLRINGNTLFNEKQLEEVEYEIIARMSQLLELNGVEITSQERENAELWWLSQCQNSSDVNRSRVEQLCTKYGKSLQVDGQRGMRSDLIKLEINLGANTVELQVLQTIEILRLKSLICRLTNLCLSQFQLFYYVGSSKQDLHNELSLVSSYGFIQGQKIYINRH
jgi:Leucine-rich repeat (LRR) protein